MSRKLKIAVIAACPFPYPRGTPIRILRMAEGLAAHGHEVHVITYHLGQAMDDLPFAIHRIPNIPTYQKFSPGPTYQKIVMLDTLLAIKILNVVRNKRSISFMRIIMKDYLPAYRSRVSLEHRLFSMCILYFHLNSRIIQWHCPARFCIGLDIPLTAGSRNAQITSFL